MDEADEEATHGVLTMALFYLLKVIRMTGFMKGLYTDAEMKSENVKVGLRAPPLALMKGIFVSHVPWRVPSVCWLWLGCRLSGPCIAVHSFPS